MLSSKTIHIQLQSSSSPLSSSTFLNRVAFYKFKSVRLPPSLSFSRLLIVSSDGYEHTHSSENVKGSIFDALFEPIQAIQPTSPHPSLINEDIKPVSENDRTFNEWDIASLWIGLVIGIPTWYLAGSLVDLGMAWYQGILTVFLANVIILIPLILSGHAGCKYGVPFPVLARAAFGIKGANVASVLRGLVACGWFGIQTWFGGQAILELGSVLFGVHFSERLIPYLSISFAQFGSFMVFWAMQIGIIWNGIESIRVLEAIASPVLVLLCIVLLVWAWSKAGGLGPMLSAPSQFSPGQPKFGQFWKVFFPALTANVGFWATLSLNIPDFTRYSKSQKAQMVGQSLGLPLSMAAFTFLGLAVTSSTMAIYGVLISDPIQLLSRVQGRIPLLLSLFSLILATLTTNIAANVVAPANALVNLSPERISFRLAALLSALFAIFICPWRLIQSTDGFIYAWLIGYSALLGPLGGIVITDYFLVRKRVLDSDSLFSIGSESVYWYRNGYNPASFVAALLGSVPSVPGFLQAVGLVKTVPVFFSVVYGNAWVFGFVVSSLAYYLLMKF